MRSASLRNALRATLSPALRIALAVLILAAIAPAARAQGRCANAQINQAFAAMRMVPNGSGNDGQCNPQHYGGGSWVSAQDLQTRITHSIDCQDVWLGQIYWNLYGRKPQGQECNIANYGAYPSYMALTGNVQGYQARLRAPAPMPQPVQQPRPQPVQAPASGLVGYVHLISSLGSRCLGVENEDRHQGARIILWNCVEQQGQEMVFTDRGDIRTFQGSNFCMDSAGGAMQSGAQIISYPCNGKPNQQWRFQNGQIRSANGLCIDLRGGAKPFYLGNQDAILYQCNGQPNQTFVAGVSVPAGSSTNPIPSGTQTNISPLTPNTNLFISHNGSAIITQDGGGLIAQGGGNLIAQGGGNLIAQGGGNLIAQGGGNIVIVPAANGIIVPTGIGN